MIEVFQTRSDLYDAALPKGGVGAELGVQFGYNIRPLMATAKPHTLHLCDAWEPQDGSYESAVSIAAAYPQADIVRAFDHDWLPQLADGHLDWVYVDTMHDYEQTRRELQLLRYKVRRGGIIAGHDLVCFAEHTCQYANTWGAGVMRALFETIAEGWLEMVALTQGGPPESVSEAYPSWACRIKD